MRKGFLVFVLVSGGLFASSAVLADTVVIHRVDDTGVVVPAPPVPEGDHKVVIEHRSNGDCDSKTVHKENDEGDTKTVKKTHCE